MIYPPNVERWREQAKMEGADVSIDLLLAIIYAESGGIPGRISELPSACAELPTDSGSTKKICNDLGLTQINPQTALFFNEHKPANFPPVTFEDLTGTDERATRQQIRVGAWLYSFYLAKLHQYDGRSFPAATPANANSNQLKLALCAYGAGFGGLTGKLDALKKKGMTLSFENLVSQFPTWPGLKGAIKKWSYYQQPTDQRPGVQAKKSLPDWLPVVVVLGASFLYRKYKRKNSPRILTNPMAEGLDDSENEAKNDLNDEEDYDEIDENETETA